MKSSSFFLLVLSVTQLNGGPASLTCTKCLDKPSLRICCENKDRSVQTCCNPATIIHDRCADDGTCNCQSEFYGYNCQLKNACTTFFTMTSLFNPYHNCGHHGTCNRDSSTDAPIPILVCDCEPGWYNNWLTQPPGKPSNDGGCRLEDPCYTTKSICNRDKCSTCKCNRGTTDTGHKIEGTPRQAGFYTRYKHTCDCAADHYIGVDGNDPHPRTMTCYKKKCPDRLALPIGVDECHEENGEEPTFTCNNGWSGPDCSVPDYCVINKHDDFCMKNGDAGAKCPGPIRDVKLLTCTCSRGFTGPTCTETDYCITRYSGDPHKYYCGRFGTCDSGNSTATKQVCACQPGSIGAQCVEDGCKDSATHQLCIHANDPTCVPSETQDNEYTCKGSTDAVPDCEQGWDGAKCNKEDVCVTGKKCNSGEYKCEGCCKVNKGVAASNPANPHFFKYEHTCDCDKMSKVNPSERLYSGINCKIENKCAMERDQGTPYGSCSGNGYCEYTDTVPDPWCVCKKLFFGNTCDMQDYCAKAKEDKTDPCNTADGKNGNKCNREGTFQGTTPGDPPNYNCTCAPGFRSKRCEPDPCYKVQCQYAGTPQEMADGTCPCICAHGRHGPSCEFKNECDPNPCNTGSCTPVGNERKCTCPDPPSAYTDTCEEKNICLIDPSVCDHVPGKPPINKCTYGGAAGKYICDCVAGWTKDKNVASPNCFQQDHCTDPNTKCHDAGTKACASVPPNTVATCTCKEDEYYYGDKCQNQDICYAQLPTSYCVIGTCVTITPTTATCTCPSDRHGPRCEWINRCNEAPPVCQNGGTCAPVVNDYSCACPTSHIGKDCEYENGCVRDDPCKNGGTCTPRPNAAGKDDWTCACGPEYQRQPDCSERDPCVRDNKCRNGGTCSRVDNVRIQCDCAVIPGERFMGALCEIERGVIRLDGYPVTANVGQQLGFVLIVERRGTTPTFRIDLGDSFNFEISESNLLPLNAATIETQRGILDAQGRAILTTFANQGWDFFPFTHIYNSKGTFTVTTTVLNSDQLSPPPWLSQVTTDSTFCIPRVTLQNCGRSRSRVQDPKVPTFERKSRFVIEGSLYYDGCTPSAGIKFKWDLFRLTAVSPYPRTDNEWELSGITAHENNDQKHIIFLPYSLLQGEYWIQLFVYYELESDTSNAKPVGNLDWCYFNLKNSPPIARIEGGNSRTIHFHAAGNEPLTLNASSSIDQNDPQNPKLTFKWSYKIEGDATTHPCSGVSKSPCSSPVVQVHAKTLDITKSYTFHVDVQSVRPNEPTTTATAYQKIDIATEGIEVLVRCIENCLKFNPGDTVHLECGCRDCTGLNVVYTHTWDSQYGKVTTIGPRTFHLTLAPDDTPAQEVREFACIGTGNIGRENHVGFSVLPIVINKPPVPGTCPMRLPLQLLEFLQPTTSGQVRFDCSDFRDPAPPNLPLIYQVNAIIPNNGDLILPGGILLYHDVGDVLSLFYFPMGEHQESYEIHLEVQVSDAFGLPAKSAEKKMVKIMAPTPGGSGCTGGIPNCLQEIQKEFRARMDKSFGFATADGSDVSRLMAAGDNQKALQLILSVLYTQKTFGQAGSELSEISRLVTIEERKNTSDRIMSTFRQIPLYSHLIVKQVMQGLYLLSYYAESLTDETLLSCAEQLIQTAKYFRNFVLKNQEVIFKRDIAQLARAGKFAAENIMVETEKRGRALLAKDAQALKKAQEVQLQHLYQVDRDYFTEVDELTSDNANVGNEHPNTTLDPSEVEAVKRMSSICQRAFISMVHLLEATAFQEVVTTTTEIQLPGSEKVKTTVDIQRVDELDLTHSTITFTPEIIPLLKKQNVETVQIHYVKSEIDPYFGDFDVSVATHVISLQIEADDITDEKGEQWIRILETVQPSRIQIPLRDPSKDILGETIQNETANATSGRFVSVELVPFDEISDLNPNIKMYHLSLISGSSFYMIVTTRSEPKGDYKTIEYQAALVRDYRPTTEEFCRLDDHHTRRFSSGEVIQFSIDVHEQIVNLAWNQKYLDFYIGIWPFDESGKLPFGTPLNFSVNFVQLSCLTRNEDETNWVGKGCEVSDFVAGKYLECECHHLSIFAGSVLIPPNKVDVINDLDLFLTIPENYIVPATVGAVLCLWCLFHLICFWKDRNDLSHHTGITIMCEIGENFSHTFYLVRIVTGSRISAGTTANVSIQIYGEKGRSKVYVVKDPTLSVLNRGGNDSFLISSAKDLGKLEKIRVWHDNTGPRPGWYLRKIHVRDVKTGQRWYFFADTWLSMTYEKDPNIIREFRAATPAELNSWRRRFNDRLVEEFNNSHLWFSMFFRLPSSNFTRCQRLVCSIGILMSHMLFNIMWEGIPTLDHITTFEVGDFSINLRQVLLGLQIAIVASPLGMLLILLFRRIRIHRIPTLVVWQDRVKRSGQDLIKYREEHLFMPDRNGEFTKCVIPAKGGGDEGDDGEGLRPFSIPATDMAATEAWVRQDTRGFGLRPPSQREPDAFVHKVDEKETPTAPALLRISRRAIAESVRRTDPSAFIYSGDGNFEDLFHADILARAEENPPWKGFKRKDLHAIEETMKAELPKLRPVEVVDKEGRKNDVIYHGISLELCLMSPVYKKKGYLPWWFIYISWTIAILTILTCAFFTTFYGLSIGRLRSKHWASEIGFAFLQTLIVTQPVRIVIVAFIFSLIYRKIHASDEDRFQVVVADGQEDLSGVKKLHFVQFKSKRSYPPLSGSILLELRVKARRRNELKKGLVALFFHALAMLFLASIISNSSSAKFAVTQHLKDMLDLNEGGTFAKIKTTGEFYDYMNNFARIVNPLQNYNGVPVAPVGDARYESTIMSDNEVMILGIPRIRQVRIKQTECPIHENLKRFYTNAPPTDSLSPEEALQKNKFNCTQRYQSVDEDGDTYNPFWKEVIGSSRSWKSTNDVWIWRTPNFTRSIMLNGKVAKYDAGGYVAELGMQQRKTKSVLNYLRQTNWIDTRTRAVFVEMGVIVPNVNIFADVLLTLELSPAGAYVTTGRILPLQITFPPTSGEVWRSWVTVSYIGISLYTIGLIFALGRGIAYNWLHYRMGFIGNLWLWVDFVIAMTSLLSIGLAFKFQIQRKKIHEHLDTSLVNEFINLQRIAFWDYMHTSLFAAVFGLCIIKSWRFLILMMDRFYILALTLRLTARFLIGFIFLICILVVAFACWGWLAFGDQLEQFHSISHAFLELKHQLLLPTFYREITMVHSVVGRLYFLLFGLSLVLVGMNLIVALLSSGFTEAKEIARQRRHRETYWTALKKTRIWGRIFGFPQPKQPEQKLPIPPLRLKAMENSTAAFMRGCVQTKEFQRMREMAKYCNEVLLKGTGYSVMSKEDKKKRLRDSMNTTLIVPKQRLEQMRRVTINILRRRLRVDLTPEEAGEYAKFHLKLLDIKLNKVRKMLEKLDGAINVFLEYLEQEDSEALEVELRRKADELKQSAMGWRRYLPPEVLLNTSASQHPYDPPEPQPADQLEQPRTSRTLPETHESPIARLRRRNYF